MLNAFETILAMQAACSLKQQSVHKFHSSSFHYWSLFRLGKQMFQVHRGLLCFPLWWQSNFSFRAISRSNPSTSEDMVRKQIFRTAKHEHAGILCVHFNTTLAFRSSKEAISVPLRTLKIGLYEMGRGFEMRKWTNVHMGGNNDLMWKYESLNFRLWQHHYHQLCLIKQTEFKNWEWPIWKDWTRES